MSLATQAAQAHRAGRLAEAARHYHDMLQAQPDDFDALHMLGVLLSQQGQRAAALPLLERAVALRPDVAAAWINRGLALASQDRHHDAADSFDKALAVSPDYPEAHFNRANTFVALTQLKQADADFARAVALRPDYVDAHYNRGLVLAKLNHHPQALAASMKLLPSTPRMSVPTWLAAMRSGNFVERPKDFAAANRR